jgi:hypothetical protein
MRLSYGASGLCAALVDVASKSTQISRVREFRSVDRTRKPALHVLILVQGDPRVTNVVLSRRTKLLIKVGAALDGTSL